MTKNDVAYSIHNELNPNFAIDPMLIATIISIIVQIIKLIYDYKNPKQLLDDVENPGIIRSIYLSYKINQILGPYKQIGTMKFLSAIRSVLRNKSVSDIQNLMNSCK
jgi:hypothetical protein